VTNPVHAAVLRGIVKTYRVESVEVHALRGVNIEIRGNCVTAISGPSGSGKTTLLNLIGCIDRPDQGEIEVAGTPVGDLPDAELSDFRATHLGFVFQSFNLIPVLTVYENVEYPLRLTGLPAAHRRARVLEMLDAVGLGARARHRPGQLSGGQQQRVAIARALAAAPRVVLADEPTANLDSQTGAAIIELMRRIQKEHRVTIVICSHDPKVIAAADDTVVIHDGQIDSVERSGGVPDEVRSAQGRSGEAPGVHSAARGRSDEAPDVHSAAHTSSVWVRP
jgi:putative ABC transport system ATP-binding protein